MLSRLLQSNPTAQPDDMKLQQLCTSCPKSRLLFNELLSNFITAGILKQMILHVYLPRCVHVTFRSLMHQVVRRLENTIECVQTRQRQCGWQQLCWVKSRAEEGSSVSEITETSPTKACSLLSQVHTSWVMNNACLCGVHFYITLLVFGSLYYMDMFLVIMEIKDL